MPKACRVGDGHACGDTDTTGSSNVRFNSKAAHRLDDGHAHSASQIQASGNVRVNKKGIARIGDNQSADALLHPPNPQTSGSPNVRINGA